MFYQARVKLTVYYLIIATVILTIFSFIIYQSFLFEFRRGLNIHRLPPEIENQIFDRARDRVLLNLLIINVSILTFTGVGGYFLAGKTLDPIKKNIDEQKEFIGNASHELRTPLTSLRTEIEVTMRDKKMTVVDARKIFRSNLEEVERMQKLTNYLLEFNKLEENSTGFEMKPIDLEKVILKAIGKRKVIVELQKTSVVGNKDLLEELISILVDNAFKYAGKNPIITVRTKNKTIEVEDNGIGIDQKDLPHIFDKFYRGDKSRARGGYGLGLSIAKNIADLHGAKIEVKSKFGLGSTFYVVFSGNSQLS